MLELYHRLKPPCLSHLLPKMEIHTQSCPCGNSVTWAFQAFQSVTAIGSLKDCNHSSAAISDSTTKGWPRNLTFKMMWGMRTSIIIPGLSEEVLFNHWHWLFYSNCSVSVSCVNLCFCKLFVDRVIHSWNGCISPDTRNTGEECILMLNVTYT